MGPIDSYEIGDRVILTDDHPDDNPTLVKGMTGTVCADYRTGGGWVPVCWDEKLVKGHDCGGTCEKGYGWNTHPGYLSPLPIDACDEITAAGESDILDFLTAQTGV